MERPTAIELLKAYTGTMTPGVPPLDRLIGSWIEDKQFSVSAIRRLASANIFGAITRNWVLRSHAFLADEIRHVMTYYGRRVTEGNFSSLGMSRYNGTRMQNRRIDMALAMSGKDFGYRVGSGAAAHFKPSTFDLSSATKQIHIAVIGYGAAGILVTRALRTLGFSNVDVYDKRDGLGIWDQRNVYSASRNNPLRLSYDEQTLEAAPGSGESVRSFLKSLSSPAGRIKANIAAVVPSYLKHTLIHETGGVAGTSQYAIVVNCAGLGSPRAANDKERMSTSLTQTELGERWQRQLTPGEARRKHFTFVGLGNSTAEMLRQVHLLQDAGEDVDYRVLTHYPLDAVENPDETVHVGTKRYRVFRDITMPNLVSYQGDLSISRYDYYRALRAKKIVADGRQWARERDYIHCALPKGDVNFKTDHLFTLIGYRHPHETKIKMGLAVGPDECPNLDYDGEVQTSAGREKRLRKGYFVFGALGANSANLNEIVIPGMLFRLPDLLTSILFRAEEAAGE